jgi:hypothetical protein
MGFGICAGFMGYRGVDIFNGRTGLKALKGAGGGN